MILAVDFDDTLSFAEYPNVRIDPMAVCILLQAKERGHKLILWTCRHDESLDLAVMSCACYGLYFDAINQNEPEHLKEWIQEKKEQTFSPKIYADLYIDDKAQLPGEKIPWMKIDSYINGEPDYKEIVSWINNTAKNIMGLEDLVYCFTMGETKLPTEFFKKPLGEIRAFKTYVEKVIPAILSYDYLDVISRGFPKGEL